MSLARQSSGNYQNYIMVTIKDIGKTEQKIIGMAHLTVKCCLQHVKFATKTKQVRTVFSKNFFECLQREISHRACGRNICKL